MKYSQYVYSQSSKLVEREVLLNVSILVDALIANGGERGVLGEISQEIIDDIMDFHGDEIDEPLEFLEWWAVSNYLAGRLIDMGEFVTMITGFNVWGRQTTGQRIAMDDVITEIAVPETRLERINREEKDLLASIHEMLSAEGNGWTLVDTDEGFVLRNSSDTLPPSAYAIERKVEEILDCVDRYYEDKDASAADAYDEDEDGNKSEEGSDE